MSELDFNKIFSSNLNHYLFIHDMSQAELAEKIGVSTASVSAWCNGKKTPRMDKVDKMCSLFNITRSALMTVSERKEKSTPPTDRRITRLVDLCGQLNDLGKDKALEYVTDLSEQNKYTSADHLTPIAAHNDYADDPDEQVKMMRDLDLLSPD